MPLTRFLRYVLAALGERGLVIVAGLALLAVGLWMVHEPLAFIVLGMFLLLFALAPLVPPLFRRPK